MKTLGEMIDKMNPADVLYMILAVNKFHIGCENNPDWDPNRTAKDIRDDLTMEFARIVRSESSDGKFTMASSRDPIIQKLLESVDYDIKKPFDVYALFPNT